MTKIITPFHAVDPASIKPGRLPTGQVRLRNGTYLACRPELSVHHNRDNKIGLYTPPDAKPDDPRRKLPDVHMYSNPNGLLVTAANIPIQLPARVLSSSGGRLALPETVNVLHVTIQYVTTKRFTDARKVEPDVVAAVRHAFFPVDQDVVQVAAKGEVTDYAVHLAHRPPGVEILGELVL